MTHKLAIFVVFALVIVGCATCEPTIVKEPVIVSVPVYVPLEPLEIPVVPEYEECAQMDSRGLLACVGRNVVKLREYARLLLDEIEAHNAAVDDPHE